MGFEVFSYTCSMFPWKKLYFFNVGFETYYYIYSMFSKKNYIFSMWDKNLFGSNTFT